MRNSRSSNAREDWLLSEEAGHDVGDEPALQALAGRVAPRESAATLGIVDVATRELPVIRGRAG